jgi:peptidoglycan/xylan/chitin deacetylase (PgdA/CDA1 family)
MSEEVNKHNFDKGIFVISLDFELHWGVSETKTVNDYKENLNNVRLAIKKMLELFKEYEIHVTWATVGFLFCRNKDEILSFAGKVRQPQYTNSRLSNYRLLPEIGNDYMQDPYHFGDDVIPLIQSYPHQEIGTHTFSHYYCLEEGQSPEEFADDIDAANAIASEFDLKMTSIVFPRNQYSDQYLQVCVNKGLQAYRGNQTSWLYKPLAAKGQHLIRRAGRLADSYINISGFNSHAKQLKETRLYNIPASRFLRPYSSKLAFLENMRLKRIKNEMNFAARNNRLYHLWWHPHNFGKYVEENIAFLEKILQHYSLLKQKFSFTSLNMGEILFV